MVKRHEKQGKRQEINNKKTQKKYINKKTQ